jgi:NADPH-dependent 2,4-dienoyl-CoA reductase/sulfur reductase-like enzyme
MNNKQLSRRDVLTALSAAAAAGTLSACATMEDKKTIGKVVVVGADYGGATAKYLRMWSGARSMSLVDPNEAFISCPISNLVLGGSKTMADITVSYGGLDKYGVKRVRDTVTAIDADKKQVRLASGGTLSYDRLVVSPGIEFMYDRLQGWSAAGESTVLHAWKAGPQTVALRRQLTELKDGGVIVMAIPLAPYRCPPGPYERACQVGWYLNRQSRRAN